MNYSLFDNLREKATKGLMWSGLQIWGGQAISFIVFVVLSRLIKPDNFGLLALAVIFLALIEVFQDQGFSDAIIQRQTIEDQVLDTAFWTNLLISGFLTLCCFFLSGLVSSLFHEPRLIPIIQMLSVSFFLSGLSSTQQAILRRDLAFKKLALRSITANIIGGTVAILMAILGFGVWSLVAQYLVVRIVGVIILWRVSDWRPHFCFDNKHFKGLLSFGSNIVGLNLLTFLNRHSDDFLIGYFLGSTLLGYYTIAYKLLFTLTGLFNGVTGAVAFPVFSRLQNDRIKMRTVLYKTINIVSIVAFPTFVGGALLAPEITLALYGAQWSPSIPVMQILFLIGIIHSLFNFNQIVMIAAGRPFWRLSLMFFNAVVNIIGFLIAVRWGIVAVAIAYVVRGYLFAPIEIWVLKKTIDLDVKIYISEFTVALTSTSIMALCILVLKYYLNPFLGLYWQIFIYTVAGVLAYSFVLLLIRPSIIKEILSFLRFLTPTRKAIT